MIEARDQLVQRIVTIGRSFPTQIAEAVAGALEGVAAPAGSSSLLSVLDRVPSAGPRQELRQLLEAWREACPEEGGLPLAWALRAAAQTDHWWRESTRSDLVWTGPAPGQGVLRRTEQALGEVLRKATEELWLVSFTGYKFPELKKALVSAAERGVTVRMIIESPEVSQGLVTFTDLEKLGASLGDAATVYVWPAEKRKTNAQGKHGSLHVKCALADDRLLFITSANLTEFAMRLNMEMGILLYGGEAPRRAGDHFRWLIGEGHLVPATAG